MEAHISPKGMDPTFADIRFVYNALARNDHDDYDLIKALGNPWGILSQGAR
jgi:hypothetical protein